MVEFADALARVAARAARAARAGRFRFHAAYGARACGGGGLLAQDELVEPVVRVDCVHAAPWLRPDFNHFLFFLGVVVCVLV